MIIDDGLDRYFDPQQRMLSRSLLHRLNLTLVSNVFKPAPRSLFWAPNGFNELPEVRFEFPFNLIG